MKILIISDNHAHWDEGILHHAQWADEVWHAGDWLNLDLFRELKKLGKPMLGVHGNVDGMDVKNEFPLEQFVMREGLKVYMIHIAGKPGKYPVRVQEILGKYHPEILVCGHSHILMVKRDPKFPKTLCINPGACGLHGFHKVRTAIRMEIESATIKNMEVVEWERSSMP